jgi:DNA modification methylase
MAVVDQIITEKYAIYNGDCVEVVSEVKSDSVGFCIYSPPFSSLYTYSNSDRDMGNSKTNAEFMQHFGFLVKELYRVLKPGRIMAVHCMNLPSSKQNDGFIGIKDFRGDLIRLFQSEGFIFHSEVTIWKDPVLAMQRTKAIGLLHKQLKKDSTISRQGIPDYLVVMRKPGENDDPVDGPLYYFVGDDNLPDQDEITRGDGSVAKIPRGSATVIDVWQRYASPVWMDINQTRTLQFQSARAADDERHICPLQLDVIERAMQLWSKEGDVVLTPFLGIGSEAYVAVKMGRKAIGAELKPSYFQLAARNMDEATRNQYEMFAS